MNLQEIIKAVEILPTFMPEDDMACYYKYANIVNNGFIVDIATGWGKSVAVMAMTNHSNKIVSCDPGDYPIYQGWASDVGDYTFKIENYLKYFKIDDIVDFFPETAEVFLDRIQKPVDLLHFDNWSEINGADTTELLKRYVDKVVDGGYILFRNYGRGDREEYTKSINNVTVGMKSFNELGLIKVFQK